MPASIVHAILIIATIAVSFLLRSTDLGLYDLQLAAICFIVLYLARRLVKKSLYRVIQSIIATFVITTVVLTTGVTHSPFFFLLYFLLFSLSLLLEPVVSITTTITLVLFLLFALPPNQPLEELIPVFSLAFITPFAHLLGKEYVRITTLQNRIIKDRKDNYLFLSLVLKNHIQAVLDASENYLGDHHLESIKKNASQMLKLIDEYEKNEA